MPYNFKWYAFILFIASHSTYFFVVFFNQMLPDRSYHWVRRGVNIQFVDEQDTCSSWKLHQRSTNKTNWLQKLQTIFQKCCRSTAFLLILFSNYYLLPLDKKNTSSIIDLFFTEQLLPKIISLSLHLGLSWLYSCKK